MVIFFKDAQTGVILHHPNRMQTSDIPRAGDFVNIKLQASVRLVRVERVQWETAMPEWESVILFVSAATPDQPHEG